MTPEAWLEFFEREIDESKQNGFIGRNNLHNLSNVEINELLTEIAYVLGNDTVLEDTREYFQNDSLCATFVSFKTSEGRIVTVAKTKNNIQWVTIYSNGCITKITLPYVEYGDRLRIQRVFEQENKRFVLNKHLHFYDAYCELAVFQKSEEDCLADIDEARLLNGDYHVKTGDRPSMMYFLTVADGFVSSNSKGETEFPDKLMSKYGYPDFVGLQAIIYHDCSRNVLANNYFEQAVMPRINDDIRRFNCLQNPNIQEELSDVLLGYVPSIYERKPLVSFSPYYLPSASNSKGWPVLEKPMVRERKDS